METTSASTRNRFACRRSSSSRRRALSSADGEDRRRHDDVIPRRHVIESGPLYAHGLALNAVLDTRDDPPCERVHRGVTRADAGGRIARWKRQNRKNRRPGPDPEAGPVELERRRHHKAHRVEEWVSPAQDEADKDRPGNEAEKVREWTREECEEHTCARAR